MEVKPFRTLLEISQAIYGEYVDKYKCKNKYETTCSNRFVKNLLDKYTLRYMLSGFTRNVFDLNDEFVIKLPKIDSFSIRSNFIEYILCKYIPDYPIAKCELYFFNDLPVIVMEKLDRNLSYNEAEDFCSQVYGKFPVVDGIQIGKNSQNQIQIFDGGEEMDTIYKFLSGIPVEFINLVTTERPSIEIFFDKYAKIS